MKRFVKLAELTAAGVLIFFLSACSLFLGGNGGFVFDAAAGTYDDYVDIVVSYGRSHDSLHYTTDGSAVTVDSPQLISELSRIRAFSTTGLKVAAVEDGVIVDTASAQYTVNRSDLQETVYLSYSYDQAAATVELDEESSSPYVGIASLQTDTSKTASNTVGIKLNGVGIVKDTKSYIIRDAVIQEQDEYGTWFDQVESQIKLEGLTNLAAVLVLDRSESLGPADFALVKSYAKDFIDLIFDKTTQAYIGIVDFSTTINNYNMTDDRTKLYSYIDSLSMDSFTSLYDAVSRGTDMLDDALFYSPDQYMSFIVTETPRLVWSIPQGDVGSTASFDVEVSYSGGVVLTKNVSVSAGSELFNRDGRTWYAYEVEEGKLSLDTPYEWRWNRNSESWKDSAAFTISEVHGKAMVTFTDGVNNNSLLGNTPSNLSPRISGSGIKSFTMGLEGKGGLNEPALQDLAVAGQYAKAEDIEVLEEVFRAFSQAVSQQFDLSYARSSGNETDLPIRITLIATEGRDDVIRPMGTEIDFTPITFSDGHAPDSFEFTGNRRWSVVSSDSSDEEEGEYSLKAGNINDDQESIVTLRMTVPDGITLNAVTFDYKVSSESGCDYLEFWVDGSRKMRESGNKSSTWSKFSENLGGYSGEIELSWKYTKDYWGSSYDDTAWIDNIRISVIK